MEDRVIDIEIMTKESKKALKKARFKEKVNNVKEWIVDNKEIVVAGLSTIAGIAVKTASSASKNRRLKKEQELKDCYCYDRSLGHYWQLNRKLTNNEWTEIDHRKRNGERLSDILNELRVLK